MRIEPAEVEAALLVQPGVDQAVVLCTHGRLVAFVTGSAVDAESLCAEIDPATARHTWCRSGSIRDSLPLTPNGKLDVRRWKRTTWDNDMIVGATADRDRGMVAAVFAGVLGDRMRSVPTATSSNRRRLALGDRGDRSAVGGVPRGCTRRALFEHPSPPSEWRVWLDQRHTVATRIPLVRRDPDAPDSAVAGAATDVAASAASTRAPPCTNWCSSSSRGRRRRGRTAARNRGRAAAAFGVAHRLPRRRRRSGPAGDVPSTSTCPGSHRGSGLLRRLVEFGRSTLPPEDTPVRVQLWRTGSGDYALAVVIHHIALDGGSMGPLLADLDTAYRCRADGTAPHWMPLAVDYADYAVWMRQLLGAASDPDSLARAQLEHWSQVLPGWGHRSRCRPIVPGRNSPAASGRVWSGRSRPTCGIVSSQWHAAAERPCSWCSTQPSRSFWRA